VTEPIQENHAAWQRLEEEVRALRQKLAERDQEVEQLSAELAETNKGVVALYAELDDKAEALREASDLKSRFLSYMSHEFRTPLGAIRSLTRLLLDLGGQEEGVIVGDNPGRLFAIGH